ncbi:MAG: alpha-amylase family glycosyl hydrolase [Prolixibacteraceae bacterium]
MPDKKYLPWWQKEVIYQVYPRSFMDINHDGVGDLQGIINRLDYLEWLGIKAVWISPVYPSPLADFGYDISDYQAIDSIYGTMDDFNQLMQAAHSRKMKIIMDLVPNHTSEKHDWFKESRSSKNNPKRDWYIWKDPGKNGEPPNNWISEFGGSAWQLDNASGQYYYHTFLKEQPDLNWYNPEVRTAMWNTMRFWLRKGVDGFRIDVLWYLIKDEHFRDDPPNPDWEDGMPEHDKNIATFSSDQPQVHDVIAEMRKVADEFEDRLLIGEIYLPIAQLVNYYGKEKDSGVHLPFNFHLISTEWDAAELYKLIAEYEGAVADKGWPNWVLGNHDKSRIKTRIGEKQAWNAAMLLLTLRGTPTIYYGDEIGMEDAEIPRDKIVDPRELIEPGIGVGRDPERTPMQWNSEKYAGFSETETWLPVNPNYKSVNVESQQNDPHSLLSFYRKIIQLRQKEPALYGGDYFPAGIKNQLFCYIREHKNNRFMICLNIGKEKVSYTHDFKWKGKTEIAKKPEAEGAELENTITLEGGECLLVRLNS